MAVADYGMKTIDGKFFVMGVPDQNEATGVGAMKFWTGTQAEYDAIVTPETDVIYLVQA